MPPTRATHEPTARPHRGGLFAPGAFSRTLRPPERMTPSRWAERHVVIERSQSAFPGPLDHARAPYLAQMIDLVLSPGVSEVNIMKASQVGVSAALRWLIGYLASEEPDPCGMTLPDREKGETIISERVMPFFERTPPLRALHTGNRFDQDKQQIKLANGYVLFLMWSGSPSSMASHPLRVCVNDEVDKFSAKATEEADPVALTRRRLRTYGYRSRLINVSTPTTRNGPIFQLFDGSTVRLYFLVPCPACGARQRLVWDRVAWSEPPPEVEGRARRSEWIEANEAAWYGCAACGAKWSDREKNRAMAGGRWGTCGEDGLADGVVDDALAVKRWPAGTKIGMHINAIYAAWEPMPKLAARFVLAKGRFEEMKDFRQNDLGEPFEQQVDRAKASSIGVLHNDAAPEGTLPEWTARLLMAIDTQKDHFWYVVRAFGPGFRSQRVLHGRAESFDELDRVIYQTPFSFLDRSRGAMLVEMAGIDSGGTRVWAAGAGEDGESGVANHPSGAGDAKPSRVMEVYAWALQRQNRVRVLKGDSKPRPGERIRRGTGIYVSGRQEHRVPIWLLDVHTFQDELAWMMGQQAEEVDTRTGEATQRPLWGLNARRDGEYERHMSNLHKVTMRERGSGSRVVERWVPVSGGARVDYRACEGYMIALAELAQVRLLPDLPQWRAMRDAERTKTNQPKPKSLTTPDGRPYLASQR